MLIEKKYQWFEDEIASLCHQVGRNPQEVKVIAVSKTVGVERVEEAFRAGLSAFGENRSESLAEKQHAFPQAQWHFIGNIQSRKISEIVEHASLVHSFYQVHHLKNFDEAACKNNKVQEMLIEVNVSGESSKGGILPDDLMDMLEYCRDFPHIKIKGLMTMAPREDIALARSCFNELKEIQKKVRIQQEKRGMASDLDELSMGMSEDWREAVVAGATIIRIGRMIFDDNFDLR